MGIRRGALGPELKLTRPALPARSAAPSRLFHWEPGRNNKRVQGELMRRSLPDRYNGAAAPAAPPGRTHTDTYLYLSGGGERTIQGRTAPVFRDGTQFSSVSTDAGKHGAPPPPPPSLTSTSGNVLNLLRMSHVKTFLSSEMILTPGTWKVLKRDHKRRKVLFALLLIQCQFSHPAGLHAPVHLRHRCWNDRDFRSILKLSTGIFDTQEKSELIKSKV